MTTLGNQCLDYRKINKAQNPSMSAMVCLQQFVTRERAQDEQKIALLRLGRLAQPGDD